MRRFDKVFLCLLVVGRPTLASLLSAFMPQGHRALSYAKARIGVASSLCFAALVMGMASTSFAVDDAAEFVEALRQRGHYDLASTFLDRAKTDPSISGSFRDRLPYERAITQLSRAGRIRNFDERTAAIKTAQRSLEPFLRGSDSKSELAADGTTKLADTLLELGRARLAKAKLYDQANDKSRSQPEKKAARTAIQQARGFYTQAEGYYEQALDKLKTVQPNSPEAELRLNLRSRLAQARLQSARSLFEEGESHTAKSPEHKKLHTEGAKQLAALYEKYSRWLVGLYAHLYEGRCYQALGQTKLALGCYEDLAVQPDNEPAFRRLITLANTYLAQTHIAAGKPADALGGPAGWLDQMPTRETRDAAALGLKYQVGEAARLVASDGDDTRSRKLLARAKVLLRDAGRAPNEFQQQARLALSKVTDSLGTKPPEPTSFAEAYQAGKDAINAMNAARLARGVVKNNKPSMAEELDAQLQQGRTDARRWFAAALRLIDEETPLTQLNEVRYLLSWLYWEQKDYARASVLAEFLARQYPGDPSSESAAKLAMAAAEALYLEAARQASETGTGDADSEAKRLSEIASYVARQWEGGDVGNAAFTVMLNSALRSGDLSQAEALLESVPPARRPALRLKLAIALWEKVIGTSSAQDAIKQKQQAAQELKAALAPFLKDKKRTQIDQTLATAMLYRAQALLEQADYSNALKTLTDSNFGPLTLIKQKHPSVSRDGYAIETYKTALRAYVSASPPETEAALATMQKLDAAVGTKDSGKLTRIYFGLGLQLQKQVEQLSAAGKTDEASRVGAAFAAFLSRLQARGADANWTTQQWIGQTLSKLAEGLPESSAQRKAYHEQAAKTFATMIEQAKKNTSFAPNPNSVLAARLQLGQAQRGAGEFDAAIETFSSMLLEREVMLDVQKAAAYTYQDWGVASDTSQLRQAISGGRVVSGSGKKLIWGWSKLAKISAQAARSRPQYRDLFFESWLNVATCRYLEALANNTSASKLLRSAKRTIRSVASQYPDLGGESRRQEFDTLMRKIQRAEDANQEPTGLAEFDS